MKEGKNVYSQEELLQRIKNKERKALSYLYDTYGPALYGLIFRMVDKQEQAEELLMFTFVKAFEDIGSYNPQKKSIFTYLMQIARGLSKRYIKLQQERVNHHDRNQTSSSDVRRVEDHQALSDLLIHLTDEQHEIFQLVFVRGNSFDKVVSQSNTSLSKAKSLMRDALLKFRELLSKEA